MLTSKSEEIDRVLGLEMGADDYLTKPFSIRELVARIRVLLRRAQLLAEGRQSPPERVLTRGRLRLDQDRYEARCGDVRLPLTISEFLLLAALARRPGHVRSRSQLLDEVHGDDDSGSERTIDSHVKRLRRKLAEAAPDYDPIEAVYGLGYRLREEP
jgi:two-component system response regulator ChvI